MQVPHTCPALPLLRVLIQIADDFGNPLLDGAVDYIGDPEYMHSTSSHGIKWTQVALTGSSGPR